MAQQEKKCILQVKNLHVHYITDEEEVFAVNGISFDLDEGDSIGLVGETGAGKTTTAMAIMQLVPDPPGVITEGEILFQGRDMILNTDAENQKIRGNGISMIFQDPMTALNPTMTVGKQIMEGVIKSGVKNKVEAKKTALEALTLAGIPSPEARFNQYPHEFSGGMRQRVMIALAMAVNPKLLICDEPTTALDVTIQAQILDLMNGLKKTSQTAIMLITHDMGVVAESTDHVLVMYAGQVVESNSTENIFNHPLHPYTQGLLKAIPRPDEDTDTLYTIPGRVPTLEEMPSGCRFAERCPYATEKCVSQGPKLVSHGEGQVRCWKYGEG